MKNGGTTKNVFSLWLLAALSFNHLQAVQDQSNRASFWADSIVSKMSLDQKVGQLFMVAAYSNKNESYNAELEDLVTKHQVGGLIFFQGSPGRQARLTNRLQEKAEVPLLIGMDLEWGLGMRLDSTINFPRQMTLGAIQDDSLIYLMGIEIARQCRQIGVHMNFAPVVDINSNPRNPVIGVRSFGENKRRVAAKSIQYMKGLQDGGVIACAKHFPGHGNTGSDSHVQLPTITGSAQSLMETEIYPYDQLIGKGLKAIMVGHLNVPAFDPSGTPASLSKPVVTGLLDHALNFQGLAITDALNMKGISDYDDNGTAEVLALRAGNDILLFPRNLARAMARIKTAIQSGQISIDEIDKKVQKILRAKYWAGLHHRSPLSTAQLNDRLNDPYALNLNRELVQASITVLRNDFNLLPLRILDTNTIASLSLGGQQTSEFQRYLGQFDEVDVFHFEKGNNMSSLVDKLKNYKTVLVGIHGLTNSFRGNFGLRSEYLDMLEQLRNTTKLVIVVFGNPYSLHSLRDYPGLICAYEDNPWSQRSAAQVIFGAAGADGALPVTASSSLLAGSGIEIRSIGRLGYALPEAVGMDSKTLTRIDQIMNCAIEEEYTPGGQILVARSGKVVYHKSFGYRTYQRINPVTEATLYDLASLTKVAATLQALMFLDGRGLVNEEHRASDYLPALKGTDKEDISLKEILVHQAGLIPFLPLWKRTLDSRGNYDPAYYSDHKSDEYPVEITSSLYGSDRLLDSLWCWVVDYPLMETDETISGYPYLYSDIGYYYLLPIINELLNQPIDQFLEQNFYNPMGLTHVTYRPLDRFSCDQIAPTENDQAFRRETLCGIVHDSGAALLGGVAAHAGLFGTANDLAKLLQMNLQMGQYGGVRYLTASSIRKFTQHRVNGNRRGLGWDKPERVDYIGPTSHYATLGSFGHLGFTGTAAWVDPQFELVYIFLSNRTYPDGTNEELIKNNIRTRVQDVVYESIWSYESMQP